MNEPASGPGGLSIRTAGPDDAAAVAEVWLRAWESALSSVVRAHSDDEVRGWVRDTLLPGERVQVAVAAGRIVGLLATTPGWVEQLYVDPLFQGRGVGTALLDLAKAAAPEGLQLWTFQVNAGARRFYERHGFAAAEFTDGSANEERTPDVRYLWRPQA